MKQVIFNTLFMLFSKPQNVSRSILFGFLVNSQTNLQLKCEKFF